MARMHSRRRGKASSKRPLLKKNPDWVPLSAKEIIQKVVELAKKGESTSLIGIHLRDQYGIPDIRLATGKNLSQILSEHNLKPGMPEDLSNLLKRVTRLQAHLAAHKHDVANKRALTLLEAKVRRLARYYKREGLLPEDWKYTTAEESGSF